MRIIISVLTIAIATWPAIAESRPAGGKKLVSKQIVTGMCVCKKGASVLFTASADLCTTPNHQGCTSAKQKCVGQEGARCRGQGGTISQSGNACTYGAKC
jgi:hypothetical protein